jgi:acyl dehydratase
LTSEAQTGLEDAWRCRLDPAPFRRLTEDVLGASSPLPLAAVLQPLALRQAAALASMIAAQGGPPRGLEGLAVRLDRCEDAGQELDAATEVTRSSGGATARLSLATAGGEPVASAALHLVQTRPSNSAAPPGAAARPLPAVALTIHITAEQVARYAEVSGDRNPLHTDRQYCAGLGLPERVVHGSLLATLAQAAAAAGHGTAMSMRFLKPCFVAEELALAVIDKDQGGRVLVHGGDGAVAAVMDWRPVT